MTNDESTSPQHPDSDGSPHEGRSGPHPAIESEEDAVELLLDGVASAAELERRLDELDDAEYEAEDSTSVLSQLSSLTGSGSIYDSAPFSEGTGEIWAQQVGGAVADVDEYIDRKTVDVLDDEFDEDEFFTTSRGVETIVTRYDLEKSVEDSRKEHYVEQERYWVNEPYAFVSIFHSSKENEYKYYAIEPVLTEIEDSIRDFLIRKLRREIKYGEHAEENEGTDLVTRAQVIENNFDDLLDQFGIRGTALANGSLITRMARSVGIPIVGDSYDEIQWEPGIEDYEDVLESIRETTQVSEQAYSGEDDRNWVYVRPEMLEEIPGTSVRPEPALVDEDSDKLTEYQSQKVMYYLKRNFVGYRQIDPIKNDINVEDISVDGYNPPVFVYHGDYEQIISNIHHGEESLDDFVVRLAQRSGKGISKREPQVDATLPDGSRAQLTLGDEVSDHGTNYTIRQFKDVPFTPVDLIAWNTFSLDQMAFLWLCIENHRSLIFAGGTASGKTTSLNAVSLFIPSGAKIVSIEDTREVELPQRNWVASVTRPSFSDDDKGDVDEFDLLEAALRQRPDYIVMGEIRGEEGRTLFQVMSTGHTTYTTFHADNVGEVIKRFTTEPINVSKTMFTALDLVSIQTQTRVQGNRVRRNKVLTEVNDYDAEKNEVNVNDVYSWQAETDQFIRRGEESSTLEELKFDRGWNDEKLERELLKRRTVLSYLLLEEMNEYSTVAATIQSFIADPSSVLKKIATETLQDSIQDLRGKESVQIDIDQSAEDMVPRPTANDDLRDEATMVMEEAKERLFSDMDVANDTGSSLDEVLAGTGMGSSDSTEDVVFGESNGSDDTGDGSETLFGSESSGDGGDDDLFGEDSDDSGLESGEGGVFGAEDDTVTDGDFEDATVDEDNYTDHTTDDGGDGGTAPASRTGASAGAASVNPSSTAGEGDESQSTDEGSDTETETQTDESDADDDFFDTEKDPLGLEETDEVDVPTEDGDGTGDEEDADVYGTPSPVNAGADSVESMTQEEKRQRAAEMGVDDDEEDWFKEDDRSRTTDDLFGDDNPFDSDDEDDTDDDGDDDWVDLGGE